MRREKLYTRCIRFTSNLLKLSRFSSVTAVSLFMLSAIIVSACTTNNPANGSVDAASQSPTSQSLTDQQNSAEGSSKGYPIKVYFSRLPQSNNDFNAVFSVKRVSPTSSVSTFSIQQLIAGPTTSEKAIGDESELKNHLTGPSNCLASANFTLKLNTKGSISQAGTATLTLCRLFASAGIGTDARAMAEITATLKQFSSIKKIVVLTKDGHCFGDESGGDMCLR